MAKRKLTRKQSWRVAKVQQEKVARISKKVDAISSSGLGFVQTGLVVSHQGTLVEVEPSTPDAHSEHCVPESVKCHFRANLGAIVTGDQVAWRASDTGYGVVEALLERHSLLVRPDPRGQVKLVAANIDFMILVITPEPKPSSVLIDRYLVAAALQDIPVRILLNKTDLLNADNEPELAALLSRYEQMGYHTLRSSTHSRDGLDTLMDCLCDHTSVFVGQSGVGKSSLVNALLPGVDLRVGELSENSKLGRHTTTTARLFHFPGGGHLIDSPGIREFGLWHLDAARIIDGFADFQPFVGHCRFRDCRHLQEPGCALRAAVADGKLHPQRLANYFAILASLAGAPQSY
jgi:ribosome biogenesis GTPase